MTSDDVHILCRLKPNVLFMTFNKYYVDTFVGREMKDWAHIRSIISQINSYTRSNIYIFSSFSISESPSFKKNDSIRFIFLCSVQLVREVTGLNTFSFYSQTYLFLELLNIYIKNVRSIFCTFLLY